MEDWTSQLAQALDRGFILTIDYGQLATDLYSLQNHQGTLVCYHRHVVSSDPYQHIGHQDMTCQVDFTSLMWLGNRHGLATVGYTLQRQFLTNLGFSSCLEALQTQGLSAARTALSRMAMMALVDGDRKSKRPFHAAPLAAPAPEPAPPLPGRRAPRAPPGCRPRRRAGVSGLDAPLGKGAGAGMHAELCPRANGGKVSAGHDSTEGTAESSLTVKISR